MRFHRNRPERAWLKKSLPLLVWILAVLSLGSYRSRHPSELWQAGGLDWETMLQAGIWLGLGVFAAYLLLTGRISFKILRRGPLSWFGVLVVFGLVSASYSAVPAYTLFRGSQMIIALALILAADLSHKHLYQAAVLFVALNFLMYAPQVLSGELVFGPGSSRLGSRFSHASVVGIASAAGAAGLYARWAREGLTRWGLVGMIVLSLGTLATISRTAILALVISVVLVSLLSRRFAVPAALASLALLLIAAELYSGSVSTFMVRGQTTFDIRTLSARTVVWKATLDRVQEGQLIGEGLGATRWQPPTSILGLGHTHNAVLEAVISLGVIGGLLVFLVLGSWFVRQFWLRRVGHGQWQLHIVDTENVAIFIPLAAFCIMDLGFMATIDQLLLFYLAAMRLVVDRNQEVRQAASQIREAQADRIHAVRARSAFEPGTLANPAASGRR